MTNEELDEQEAEQMDLFDELFDGEPYDDEMDDIDDVDDFIDDPYLDEKFPEEDEDDTI